MPLTVTAKFSMPKFGTKQIAKKAKKAVGTVKKAAPKAGTVKKSTKAVASSGSRMGGVGYRKFDSDDRMWLPNTPRPAWLNNTLPGDRGFDPLGLAKPTEYLQVDIDALDQNAASNKAGGIIGEFTPLKKAQVSTDSLQPYDEVFGLERFRETELINGRWAMLACLGCIVAEAATGVSWAEAGKVELDGASYFGFDLPFSITALVWIEVLAVGGAELYRNTELDPVKRCYPGGFFDPLDLANSKSGDRLKEAEIKHARLAMVSFFGYAVQACVFGEGALGTLALFAKNLNN